MNLPKLGFLRQLFCLFLGLAGLASAQPRGLRILQPTPSKDNTIFTTEGAISLSGTLALTGSDRRVLWTSSRGFSDLATVTLAPDGQTAEWSSTTPIPLRPGINQLRVRALGQPQAAALVNVYYAVQSPPPPPPRGIAILGGGQIEYEVIGGQAVYQGDLILGSAGEVAAGRFAGRIGRPSRLHPQSATIATNFSVQSGLWPTVNGVVRVPYTRTAVNAANIDAAILESNTQLAGAVQWVPATASDVNLVNFNFNQADQSGTCEANVGMTGGTQPIGGSGTCTVGTILHEMGHALGLYHEQSRADRNSYINYAESNVDKPQHANFDIFNSGVDSGLFNYASIMEYDPFSFSRYGIAPVIETMPAGIVLSSEMPQYTTGDVDGIFRLYGFAPTAVTVDSNPTGMQLVVDGTTCTAPCVFSNWTLGSSHALAVPLDTHGQTLQTPQAGGQSYVFGNWNIAPSPSTSQQITIVNSAGTGLPSSPVTSPAYTNYLASFIPVHPYGPTVYPANAGTVQVNPTPSTLIINGVSTKYFLDRQYITFTVNANNGYTFYEWFNVSLPNFYAKNFSFYLRSNLDYLNFNTSEPMTAFFVTDAVTTITGEAPDIVTGISPGFAVGVISSSNAANYSTPRNFDFSQDGSDFAVGKNLTLCGSILNGTACPVTPVAQSPVTTNLNYVFSQWNGNLSSGADGINITIPAAGANYNANYVDNFRVIVQPSVSAAICPGVSITTSPAGVNPIGTNGTLDAFFPFSLSSTSFTANTDSGVVNFVGWSQDLSGSASPYLFSLNGQLIATANYNVVGTSQPLAITSVSPATPGVTNGTTTLTVNGTGFTTNSGVTAAYVGPYGGGNFYPYPTTLLSATQLQIQVPGTVFNGAGYYQVFVVNSTPSGCNPQTSFTFPVANAGAAPQLSIAKSHTGNFSVGEQHAQYTILVTNTGAGSTTESVTVTDTLPSGESLVSISGAGWFCTTTSGIMCTISSALGPGLSYPAITVTVNVAANAASPQVNTATVMGGGAASATATDSTVVNSQPPVPNVVGLTQAAATTALQNAGLVVGTVTMQPSNTIPVGMVSGESPVAGTLVNLGSSVNLVLSTGPSLSSIAVTPANPSIAKGLTQQFTATGTYGDNSTKDLTAQVTWGSDTPGTAPITAGGLASGAGIGTSKISATLTGVTGSTTLTVTAPALVSIAVTPGSPSIAKGLTQQFTATGTYTDNSTQNLTTQVTWGSDTPGTATIAAGGLASAAGVGTSKISATLGGVTGSTTLTVTAATLASIGVTPGSPSIAKGLTQQFTATGTYTDSTTLNLTAQVTWASDTPGAATITAGGLVSTTGTGTSKISATLGGVTGSTTLTVTAPAVASIAVTPASPSIAKGLTQQFAATGTYTDNSTKDVTAQVTWASDTPGTATIAAGGLALAAGTGTSKISATLGGVTGSTTLTVTAATLVSIAVTPGSPSIANGLTQQFTATGTYTDNTTQNLTAQVTWGSDTPGTATITAAGLASAVGTGTSKISAVLSGVTGSTTLTVTVATLASIAVTPGTPSIAKGLTQQFTATGTYTDGTSKDLTGSVGWTSNTPGTATITAGGLASAVGTGTSRISATLGVATGSTTMTVTAAAVASIAVAPGSPSIVKGLTQQFTATGTYTDSTTNDVTAQVTWASDTPGTATIAAGGLATAAGTGTSKISATLGGVTGSTTLTVTAPTLVSIAVTPGNSTIVIGQMQTFKATGTYTDNSKVDLSGQVTWSSTNTGVAPISAAGVATAANVGTTSIAATLLAISGSTSLGVTALGPCDVNQDGLYSVADAQRIVNQLLGSTAAVNDVNGDGAINSADLQIVLNAALNLGCTLH